MSGIQKMVSAVAGTSGYKCVDGKGHLDNCNDMRGVCETNSICRFVDEIKRRGKLDKKIVSYLESNNIENGVNSKNGIELIFSLDYDMESGNRVTINLLSPNIYYFDIDKYKYNKILEMLDETLINYADQQKRYTVSNPYEAYNLISEIVYNNKKRFMRLRKELATKIEKILPNSVHDYMKFILSNSYEVNLDQSLTIDNINKEDVYGNVKTYIDNIKNLLRREFESPNKHIFPPLSRQFVADIRKRDTFNEIRMPRIYDGGVKRRKNKSKKSRKNSKKIRKSRKSRKIKKSRKMRKSRKSRKSRKMRKSKYSKLYKNNKNSKKSKKNRSKRRYKK